MGSFLQIRGARKRFGDQEVLQGVDLEIAEGEVTMLFGKSGSGKTVLLKAIAGRLPLDEGEILWRGQPLERRSEGSPPLSYLFQGDAMADPACPTTIKAVSTGPSSRMRVSATAGPSNPSEPKRTSV